MIDALFFRQVLMSQSFLYDLYLIMIKVNSNPTPQAFL